MRQPGEESSNRDRRGSLKIGQRCWVIRGRNREYSRWLVLRRQRSIRVLRDPKIPGCAARYARQLCRAAHARTDSRCGFAPHPRRLSCAWSGAPCRSSRRTGSSSVSGTAAEVVTQDVYVVLCPTSPTTIVRTKKSSDFTALLYPLCCDSILSARSLRWDVNVQLALLRKRWSAHPFRRQARSITSPAHRLPQT